MELYSCFSHAEDDIAPGGGRERSAAGARLLISNSELGGVASVGADVRPTHPAQEYMAQWRFGVF
jgi:hypothetical protein